ncbi:hypothetical protein [Streptomyces sp. NBC_00859]|uniref:hypothetical protein n=1 Tax=Streptomyces sp. NBC_00859 TaxID=2903682 RepID=UPI00386ADC47|nr:hypothetical protein OG584_00145 [Streptomyces sp. NBC_00859]WSZ86768.1 hypothetical protein OG584_34995 [Streptomyces sp. NBC_00859]
MTFPIDQGARPTPSDRTAPAQQWRIFLDLADLSGPGEQVITCHALAERTEVGTETLGSVVSFLQTVGLVRGARGKYAVTAAGWAIAEMQRRDETQARLLLQAQFLQHWSARAARAALQDAPVDQATLGQRLCPSVPGKARRGTYLVEWLVLALVVHRDASMKICPSAALTAAAGAVPPQQPPGAQSAPEPALLMGMTHSDLRALPPQHYMALLDHAATLVDLVSA